MHWQGYVFILQASPESCRMVRGSDVEWVHPLEAAFVNPGLAVVKDGNPPLTGYRFRRSSDLIEWSAWPAREVVTRIDFVFSIWKNPNRGDVFFVHSSRVLLHPDKPHACMKVWRISRTKWTPVNEQNRVARGLCSRLQRRTERAVLRMGVPWTLSLPTLHLFHYYKEGGSNPNGLQ